MHSDLGGKAQRTRRRISRCLSRLRHLVNRPPRICPAGSLDWNGEPVDDGTYEIIDDHTFVVSKEFPDVTFNYAIEGDTIMFDPVIPECAPTCFEAPWSVSVAYPGETWERVS